MDEKPTDKTIELLLGWILIVIGALFVINGIYSNPGAKVRALEMEKATVQQ